MTPRERIIAALELKIPEGLVPHIELEYQLTESVFGRKALRSGDLEGVTGQKRKDMLKRNAELWVDVAKTYDWSVITGTHWLPVDAQCESFEYIREIAGDDYMLSAFFDGTFGIPGGGDMTNHVVWLYEKPEEAKAHAERSVENSAKVGRQLIEAGAEIVFMCADYCFNDGPFLPPRRFREFVTPYLTKIVASIHEAGGYAVKHTDGNIMPILDQLVSTGIDALHSLDPMAGVDIAEVKCLYGDQICLIGNVDCSYVQSGTPEEIIGSSLYCLEYGGVDSGGYIFSSSNCIFAGVPSESYNLMLEMRKEYGYPGAKRPKDKFAMPQDL